MDKNDQLIQTRLETTLARYVAMPTVTADIAACREAIQTLAAEFSALGMATFTSGEKHPWLIATANPRAHHAKHVKILFVVHFDVVGPAHDKHFTMQTTPNKITGRGVMDMKFAAAGYYELFKDLAADDTLGAYDIGILITTDEEIGGRDGAGDFVAQGWRCDLAIIPDGGRDWNVEGRAKGMHYLYLKATGHSAHSSRPWEGTTPLPRFSQAIQDIIAHFPNDDPNGLVVGVNTVETTNSGMLLSTQTPGWVKAGISMRAFNEEELQIGMDYINEIAQKYDLTTEITLEDSPVHSHPDNPLVKEFLAAIGEERGKPTEFIDALGASDARHFAKINIPTALVYPEGGELHGANEWIKRTDLLLFYKIMKNFLQRTAFDADNLTIGSARHLAKYKEMFANIIRRAPKK